MDSVNQFTRGPCGVARLPGPDGQPIWHVVGQDATLICTAPRYEDAKLIAIAIDAATTIAGANWDAAGLISQFPDRLAGNLQPARATEAKP